MPFPLPRVKFSGDLIRRLRMCVIYMHLNMGYVYMYICVCVLMCVNGMCEFYEPSKHRIYTFRKGNHRASCYMVYGGGCG